DALHHGTYKSARGSLDALASEFGYLDAKYATARLAVVPEELTADIDWVFDSGPRYRFGPLQVTQEPESLRPELIDRLLEYEETRPYSVNEVARLNRALAQSGYFSRVDVRPRFDGAANQTIPLDVTVSPRNRHNLTTGIGVSTDETLRGRISYANRRLNRHGHRLSAGAKASFIEQTVSGEYQIPLEQPQDEWLTFQAGVRRENVDAFDSTDVQLSVSATKRRPWGWLETRFIELNRADFDIGGENDTSLFLIPGLRWHKAVADDDLYPRRGYRLNVELRGAADALLSDTSFASGRIDGLYIRPLPRAARLLLSANLGATWVDTFGDLPPSERFFAGGDRSLRGYNFESLGPLDADGQVIGGTYLGILSVEYEYPVFERWSLAAFVDSGNAFGGDGRNDGIKTSAGIGVRWRSPVGAVRVDLAHPFDTDDAVMFHLRIGPDL
ncbi:MAG: autotransporter assembly complex protein TamA, partial [Gammaproteobacteria bacterium]|nr:autotransporter assembly complex protein TamA [Gammaproteobacteria bacterium]